MTAFSRSYVAIEALVVEALLQWLAGVFRRRRRLLRRAIHVEADGVATHA